MNKGLRSTILSLVGVLVFFLLIVWIGGMINPSLQLDETALLRFVFVAVGLPHRSGRLSGYPQQQYLGSWHPGSGLHGYWSCLVCHFLLPLQRNRFCCTFGQPGILTPGYRHPHVLWLCIRALSRPFQRELWGICSAML